MENAGSTAKSLYVDPLLNVYIPVVPGTANPHYFRQAISRHNFQHFNRFAVPCANGEDCLGDCAYSHLSKVFGARPNLNVLCYTPLCIQALARQLPPISLSCFDFKRVQEWSRSEFAGRGLEEINAVFRIRYFCGPSFRQVSHP